MKKNNIKRKCVILIALIFSFNSIYSQNTGFFNYVKLEKVKKLAIDHYVNNYEALGFITMIVNPQDSLSFTLVGWTGVWRYIESPSYYYSIHNGKMVLIYNGDENNYNPNDSDIGLIVDFLSNFLDPSMGIPIKIDRSKTIPELVLKVEKQEDGRYQHPVIYDPCIVEYTICEDSIAKINRNFMPVQEYEGYPKQRFVYKVRYVSE